MHTSKTLAYSSWSHMKGRCLNKNHHKYPSYGGRGIVVCTKWLTFQGFIEDMGERPEGTSLDRIDVNGNYCKENCRWADASTQMRNRRARGKSKTLGVYTHKNRWRTYITVNSKQYLVGCFDTIEEAQQARKHAERMVGYS